MNYWKNANSESPHHKRTIKNIAVLGSGVMGSQIALLFAGAGFSTLLLDRAPDTLTEKEQKLGLSLDNKAIRNRIVNEALANAKKLSPNPVYHSKVESLITTGNFEDNLPEIAQVDWIIEVIVENLAIKQQLYTEVEKYRKPNTIISSNTSGIPIRFLAEGRSDDFKAHFLGTHFFNPPRYLKLLEIIPTKFTKPELTEFLLHFGDLYLGKTTVLAKDSPAFIANRVGVYAILEVLHLAQSLNLSVADIDKLTGTVIGHPKSATFRTGDVVGLDTLIKVANDLAKNLPDDEQKARFSLPTFLHKMEENKWFGDKTGQGFYKKTKNEKGEKEILALNLNTLNYELQKAQKFATLESTKQVDKLNDRIKMLLLGQDTAGEFYRKMFASQFAYAAHRIPEISEELFRIDQALRTGFGWELGIFETWDIVGLEMGIQLIESNGFTLAPWVKTMREKGFASFYKYEEGKQYFYHQTEERYKLIPGTEGFIYLKTIADKRVWSNAGASIYHLGDGVLNLEFHSKMNVMGSDVIEGVYKAVEMAEKGYEGLVIANEGTNFSSGANLALVMMLALEEEYDELDLLIHQFQQAMMRVKLSSVPVVVAPHNMTLGGGCELTLHAAKVQATPELYIGLVEFGVGLIPGGGGCKELVIRASDAYHQGDVELNILQQLFMNIATAKVATSAFEAKELHFLNNSDGISMNRDRQIMDAKNAVLALAQAGFVPAQTRKDIRVQGRTAMGTLLVGINQMLMGKYISEHDAKIAKKLALVMSGADLTSPSLVNEQYLLDLEREAFLSLLGEQKTMERIQGILNGGRVIRN